MRPLTPLVGLALLGLASPALAGHRPAPPPRHHKAHHAHATTVRAHTTVVRPHSVVVHRPAPRHHVVVHRPVPVHPRPAVTVVRPAPAPRVIVTRPVAPAPVVVYDTPPPVVRRAPPAPVAVPQEAPRADEIDRADTLAVGVVGGSLLSGSPVDGQLYGDPGLGLVARYRPAETVGLELGLSHHAATFSFDEKRSQTQLGGQVKLFAFPWTRVSPYALGGVTFNAANVEAQLNETDTFESVDGQWGLDGGLGVELALGNNFAIDLEGKYIGWLDERYEGEAPGAFQATAGLLYHFR